MLAKTVKINFFMTLEVNYRFATIWRVDFFFPKTWPKHSENSKLREVLTCLLPMPLSTAPCDSPVTLRASSPAANRKEITCLEFPQKPHPQRIVTIRSVWQLLKKLHSQGLSLFDLTQLALCERHLIHWTPFLLCWIPFSMILREAVPPFHLTNQTCTDSRTAVVATGSQIPCRAALEQFPHQQIPDLGCVCGCLTDCFLSLLVPTDSEPSNILTLNSLSASPSQSEWVSTARS